MALLRLIPLLQLVLFQSDEKPVKYLLFSIGQTIIDFALSFVFVIIFKYGFLGRLFGIYLSSLVFSFYGVYLLVKKEYIQFTLSIDKIKDFLSFGIPLIPHAIGGTIIAMSDRYFISYYFDNASVGVYTVAYQVGALVLLFGTSVNQAWGPMQFKLLKNKEPVMKITYSLGIIFVIVGLGVYIFSDIIFSILVDSSYWEAKEYFPFLLLGFIFQSVYFLVANFLFQLLHKDDK